MAATILNSSRAIEISLFIVKTFVKLKGLAISHKELADKLALLERKISTHDKAILEIISAINKLVRQPTSSEPKKRPIGFLAKI